MGGGGVGRGGGRSVCLCVSESAPTRRGAGSSPDSAPFQPGRNCCHFLGNPTFTAGGARDGAVRFTSLTRGRGARGPWHPSPKALPSIPLSFVRFFFYVAFRVDPGCNSRPLPSVWLLGVLCTPVPSRADSALGARPLARALQPGGRGRVLGPRPPPSPSV